MSSNKRTRNLKIKKAYNRIGAKIYVFIESIIIGFFWFCYLASKLGFLDNQESLCKIVLSNAKFVFAIGTFLSLMVLYIIKRNTWVSFGYILRFYWRLLSFIPRLIFYAVILILKLFGFLSKIIKLPRRFEIQVAAFILAIIVIKSIFVFENIYILYASMTILGLSMLVFLTSMFLWITNPFDFFVRIFNLTERIWDYFNNRFVKKEYMENNQASNQNRARAIRTLWFGFKVFEWIKKTYTEKFERVKLIRQFFAFYSFIISFTIIGFAFEYYALHKIDPKSILEIGNNFFEYLYFSIITFSTVHFGKILPHSPLAKLVISSQVLVTLYLLVSIILTFAMTTEEIAKKTVSELRQRIAKTKDKILSEFKSEFNIQEDYVLATNNIQQFEEGLKLYPFPNELIYPNAKEKKLQITTDGKEIEIILSTMDNLNKVDKYYEQNLPKNGWKKVIEGSYKNSKKSSLYFEKGNREALINLSLDVGDKTEIIVLLRPAN